MSFVTFTAIKQHIQRWLLIADARLHGTTRLVPTVSFERDKACALQPLPKRPLGIPAKRLRRRIAGDCFINVNDVRCSAPVARIYAWVELELSTDGVAKYIGAEKIASHRRAHGLGVYVNDGSHYASLSRTTNNMPSAQGVQQTAVPRTLEVYEAVVQCGAR